MRHEIDIPSHEKCGLPVQSYVYRNADGAPVLVANRYERAGGGKFFLPYDVLKDEWKAPKHRVIYNLDQIAKADPKTPIIMVEGEKCADALIQLGFLATTTFGGSNAAGKADLSPLVDRHVILWPDYDEPGEKYVNVLKSTFSKYPKMTVSELLINPEMLSKVRESHENGCFETSWDAADAVAQGWTKENIEKLLKTATKCHFSSGENLTKSEQNQPILTISELWHTPQREAFATLSLDGHREHWPLESTHFRNFLSYEHFQSEGKMLSQSALEDQRRALQGRALFEGDEHPVFMPIQMVGRLLGHSQLQTTMRYAHLADDPVRRAAEENGFTRARGQTPPRAFSLPDHNFEHSTKRTILMSNLPAHKIKLGLTSTPFR